MRQVHAKSAGGALREQNGTSTSRISILIIPAEKRISWLSRLLFEALEAVADSLDT